MSLAQRSQNSAFSVAALGQDEPVARLALAPAPESLAPEMSALEKSLLRLSLLIPNASTKRGRPSPRERAAILERIKSAGEQARAMPEPPPSLLEDIGFWLYPPHQRQADAWRLEHQADLERLQRHRAWEWRERRRRQ